MIKTSEIMRDQMRRVLCCNVYSTKKINCEGALAHGIRRLIGNVKKQ